MFMLRKKSPLGDLGGILFFPYSASGLPGLFIWKVLALASILKAPNYSVLTLPTAKAGGSVKKLKAKSCLKAHYLIQKILFGI